ncbi:Putative uncharacterized protein [Escherichia coli D6-117.29]|nr:Putative uncharacterized protein [Escherichia coli D6-117.29]
MYDLTPVETSMARRVEDYTG